MLLQVRSAARWWCPGPPAYSRSCWAGWCLAGLRRTWCMRYVPLPGRPRRVGTPSAPAARRGGGGSGRAGPHLRGGSPAPVPAVQAVALLRVGWRRAGGFGTTRVVVRAAVTLDAAVVSIGDHVSGGRVRRDPARRVGARHPGRPDSHGGGPRSGFRCGTWPWPRSMGRSSYSAVARPSRGLHGCYGAGERHPGGRPRPAHGGRHRRASSLNRWPVPPRSPWTGSVFEASTAGEHLRPSI